MYLYYNTIHTETPKMERKPRKNVFKSWMPPTQENVKFYRDLKKNKK